MFRLERKYVGDQYSFIDVGARTKKNVKKSSPTNSPASQVTQIHHVQNLFFFLHLLCTLFLFFKCVVILFIFFTLKWM